MRTTPALTALSAIALIAGLSAAARAQTHAGTWPAQAVRIITPFPPGSGGDITARPFADRLAKLWGKPVIVENRPGADGIIAVTSVLNSTNGHTILYTNGGPLTSNQISHAGKLPYEPMNDLLPISGGAEVYVGIGVPASLPVGTVADFLALAKLRPGQFNWGGTPGSLDYLIPGFFKNVGVDLTHVPYRDVTSAMQDLSQARPSSTPRQSQPSCRWRRPARSRSSRSRTGIAHPVCPTCQRPTRRDFPTSAMRHSSDFSDHAECRRTLSNASAPTFA